MSKLIKAMFEKDVNKVERIMTMYAARVVTRKTFNRLRHTDFLNTLRCLTPVIYLNKDVRVKDMPKVINFELTKFGRYLQRVNETS